MQDKLSEIVPIVGIAVGVALYIASIAAFGDGDYLAACYIVSSACFLMLLLACVQVNDE